MQATTGVVVGPWSPKAALGRKVESTASLLQRVRAGDQTAKERLIARYLPQLYEWAHGRVPRGAGVLEDADDLVQTTLYRALRRLKQFEPRREGAFLAYLQKILLNQIRDEIRQARRAPVTQRLSTSIPSAAASPLEALIGREATERYESALQALTKRQRQAFLMRVELGLTHRQVAKGLGKTSEDAARMLVARALARMAELMGESGSNQAVE